MKPGQAAPVVVQAGIMEAPVVVQAVEAPVVVQAVEAGIMGATVAAMAARRRIQDLQFPRPSGSAIC
ncbi:hypothetical protein [Leisingera caerulea]|uniref:hypothetical protein n=1 Tax=Leisingera caerulea TaxID=506591 RepID=UPI000403FE6F|nr:hypothetical protein [Leisingera caerulea]